MRTVREDVCTHLQSSSHPFEFQYFLSDHSYKQTAQSAALTAAVSPSFPPRLCPSTSLSTCQHSTHTAPTTLLPRRSAKGSPPHTDKLPAGSPLVLGYRGRGCGGEVSVTTCNEICREHYTAAAVVYCRQ